MLRGSTADGPVWFKASATALAHDGPVTAVLARLRPDAVLAPPALDVERGWLLLPDGGETLRQVREREQHARRWIEAFALYAELQIAAALTYRRIQLASSESLFATYQESVSGWLEDFLAVS